MSLMPYPDPNAKPLLKLWSVRNGRLYKCVRFAGKRAATRAQRSHLRNFVEWGQS